MAQRAIRNEAVDLLLDFARPCRHKGADVYAMTKNAREALRRQLGREEYARVERYLDSYVVLSDDGCILTTGHRTHRLKRP